MARDQQPRPAGPTRREAIASLAPAVAGSVAPTPAPPRLVPRADLVNVLEFEDQARAMLAPAVFARIAGSDRTAFDRMTLRPRLAVPTTDLDLGVTIFGASHFAPILVGPAADQKQFHVDAETATVAGAAAANAVTIVSSQSSVPIEGLIIPGTPVPWYQVFSSSPTAAADVTRAVQAGCRVICVTMGAAPAASGRPMTAAILPRDWDTVRAIRKTLQAPLVLKGVMTPAAAKTAVGAGADGLVVSNYGSIAGATTTATIQALAPIADLVAGQLPVLVDGSFRRGSDVIKALALGATAVVVTRPVMWGLAAYGKDGVQSVVEMLQTELARYMALCGRASLNALNKDTVRVHDVSSVLGPRAPVRPRSSGPPSSGGAQPSVAPPAAGRPPNGAPGGKS